MLQGYRSPPVIVSCRHPQSLRPTPIGRMRAAAPTPDAFCRLLRLLRLRSAVPCKLCQGGFGEHWSTVQTDLKPVRSNVERIC